MTTPAKDLAKEPPRSPRQRLGGYVILGRTTDKCRALLASSIGEYHYDCLLDSVLFSFKNITGDEFKKVVESVATDEEIVQWIDSHGAPKSAEEVAGWSNTAEAFSLVNDAEKRDFFIAQCSRLGLVPEKTTVFDWLEADDRASFTK